MKITDYFNLPEEKSSLEQRIRKYASYVMIGSILAPTAIGVINKPVHANSKPSADPIVLAHHDDGQTPWEQIKGLFKKRKKDYTINTLKVQVGHGPFIDIKEGYTLGVPYDKDFYVQPQKKHKLTTEVLIKRLDETYVKDAHGRKLVTKGRINPEDYCIEEGERVKVFVTYETPTKLFGSTYFYVIQGLKPKESEPRRPREPKEPEKKEVEITKKIIIEHRHVYEPAPKEEPKHPRRKPKDIEKKHKPKEPVHPRYSLKALVLMGNEENTQNVCVPEETFGGLMIEGVYYHPKIHAWANYMNVGYDVDEATWGGQVLNRRFSQASLGVDYAIGPLVAEIEGISSKNKYTPYPGNMFTMPLEESEYKGIFLGAGLRFPFGRKGFTSDCFIVGTYGVGFGKQKYKLTDNTWYAFTYDSEAITEKDCIKVHLKTPFIEGTYFQSNYNNKTKAFDGKRRGLGGKLKLPLKALSRSLDGFYIIGFGFVGEDNNALFGKNKINLYGAGIGYEK